MTIEIGENLALILFCAVLAYIVVGIIRGAGR